MGVKKPEPDSPNIRRIREAIKRHGERRNRILIWRICVRPPKGLANWLYQWEGYLWSELARAKAQQRDIEQAIRRKGTTRWE